MGDGADMMASPFENRPAHSSPGERARHGCGGIRGSARVLPGEPRDSGTVRGLWSGPERMASRAAPALTRHGDLNALAAAIRKGGVPPHPSQTASGTALRRSPLAIRADLVHGQRELAEIIREGHRAMTRAAFHRSHQRLRL